MFAWNASWNHGVAVNLAELDSLIVSGSDTSWGISGTSDGGTVFVAPNGTYSTKAEAVAALIELLQHVGYVEVS